MKKPTAMRPMTAEEIEFSSYLTYIKIPDWSGDKYILKPLLKQMAMTPPMIRETRASTIYRMLYKYRRQVPKIVGRNPAQFWRIVEEKRIAENRRVKKGKTLCEIFSAEEKEKQKKLNIDKLFDQLYKLKEERKRLGVPEITNL